jgi:hypothetical protein
MSHVKAHHPYHSFPNFQLVHIKGGLSSSYSLFPFYYNLHSAPDSVPNSTPDSTKTTLCHLSSLILYVNNYRLRNNTLLLVRHKHPLVTQNSRAVTIDSSIFYQGKSIVLHGFLHGWPREIPPAQSASQAGETLYPSIILPTLASLPSNLGVDTPISQCLFAASLRTSTTCADKFSL